MDNFLENRTFDEIEVGDSASLEHTLTRRDIELFAIMSGDVNPAHLDEEYASSDMFHEIIAHGMWSGSFISTLLGTKLPGPGTVYLSQTLSFLKPVAIGDTITARITVTEKKAGKPIVRFDCRCTNQAGREVIQGEAVVMAPTEKVRRRRVVLPDIVFKKEKRPNYHRVIHMAEGLPPLKTAVVHPVDNNSLKGTIAATEAGMITPVLVGPEHKINALAKREGLDISAYELVNTEHSHESAEVAVMLAKKGQVEALMKGKIHTNELIRPVVDKVSGLRTGRRISHLIMADIPAYPKPLFVTDTAVNIRPDLNAKRDIVQNAVDLFRSLSFGIPRVAILSAIETINEKIPSTLDATALCKMAERGQITGALLDGPLAFDNAVSEAAAKVKNIKSAVAGHADILVVPTLESGNILLKQLTLFSNASVAGVALGAQVPIILTSRSSGELARTASSALALLSVRKKQALDELQAEDE